MENEFNKKLNRLSERMIELKREYEKLEREKEKLILKKRERIRKELVQPKRRNFVRELKEGGVSLAKIARKTGINYYKIRQINLGKKRLKSKTPEYRKIRNLHSKIGYQQLRAKGVSPKDARILRTHKLRQEPIFRKKKARKKGWVLQADVVVRILKTDEIFIENIKSKKTLFLNKESLRKDVITQLRRKYGSIEVYFIREIYIKYEN